LQRINFGESLQSKSMLLKRAVAVKFISATL